MKLFTSHLKRMLSNTICWPIFEAPDLSRELIQPHETGERHTISWSISELFTIHVDGCLTLSTLVTTPRQKVSTSASPSWTYFNLVEQILLLNFYLRLKTKLDLSHERFHTRRTREKLSRFFPSAILDSYRTHFLGQTDAGARPCAHTRQWKPVLASAVYRMYGTAK